MQINLKNARRLEQSIDQVIQSLTDKVRNPVKISIYDDAPETTLDFAVEATVENINEIMQLTDIRYQIRSAISSANERSGINGLMVQDRVLNDNLHLLLTVTRDATLMTDSERQILLKRLEAKRESGASDSYMSRADEVSIGTPLEPKEIDSVKEKIQHIKRRKATIADECARLNLSETITLSGTELDLLKKHSLV